MNLLQLSDLCARNDLYQFRGIIRQNDWAKAINFDQTFENLHINHLNRHVSDRTTCLCVASQFGSSIFVSEILKQNPSTSITDGNGDTALHKACRSTIDSLEKVKILIEYDPFQAIKHNKSGCTPLHVSAVNRDAAVFAWLAHFHCIDVNVRTGKGLTPLHIASHFGCIEIVRILLARKDTNVNCRDVDGDTALHHAVANKHLRVFDFLLRHSDCDSSIKNQAGMTPLQDHPKNKSLLNRALHGTFEEMKYLIENGADCVTDMVKETPLHKACKSNLGAPEKVALLLQTDPTQSHVANSSGYYPLHLSASSGDSRVLSRLIESVGRDFDVNVLTLHENQTALHIACLAGNIANVSLLLSCPQADVNIQDTDGNTPLHLSNENGHFPVIEELKLAPNCKGDIRNKDGSTPDEVNPINWSLLDKSEKGTFAHVKEILDKGAVCITDKDGNTAMHKACVSDTEAYEKVQILTEYDESLLARYNKDGYLPIHLSVQLNDWRILEYIGDRDYINSKTLIDGRRCLHFAAQFGFCQLISNLLKRYDIDVNAKDMNGDTAAHFAARHDFQDSLREIQNHANYVTSITNNSGKTADEENPLNSAMSLAFVESSVKTIEQMFDAGAKCLTNASGDTLLHQLCQHKCVEYIPKCELLLARNSSLINKANMNGYTPLHEACLSGNDDIINHLLTKSDLLINAVDQKHRTALHIAASSSRIETLASLLQAHSLVINAPDIDQRTALHIAVFADNEKATHFLISTPEVRLNAVDKNKQTALHLACKANNEILVKLLATHTNLNVNLKDYEGYTAWNLTTSYLNKRVLEERLEFDKQQIHGFLLDLAHYDWYEQKRVRFTLDANFIRSVALIRGRLYCSCLGSNIQIYNQDLAKLDEILIGEMGYVEQMAEMTTGDLILAAGNGLYHLTTEVSVPNTVLCTLHRISTSECTSVVVYRNNVYAAEYDHSLPAKSMHVKIYSNNETWREVFNFSLPCDGDHTVTLSVNDSEIYACCWNEHKMYVLSHDGAMLKSLGYRGRGGLGQLYRPRMCHNDCSGAMLLVNDSNDRLKVLHSDHDNWSIVRMHPPTDRPTCAFYTPGYLYIASWPDTLILYTPREP